MWNNSFKEKERFGICLLFITAKKEHYWCLTGIFKWIIILSYDISRRQQCKWEPLLSVYVLSVILTPSSVTTGDSSRLPFLMKCVDSTDGELNLYSPRYSYRASLEHKGPESSSIRRCRHTRAGMLSAGFLWRGSNIKETDRSFGYLPRRESQELRMSSFPRFYTEATKTYIG